MPLTSQFFTEVHNLDVVLFFRSWGGLFAGSIKHRQRVDSFARPAAAR